MKEIISILQSLSFSNLDLLAVGVTIAAIGLLGFVIYISKPKSITNLSFLFFSTITILWSFFNYASYQVTDPVTTLWLLRIVILLGLWHSFTFFTFLFVFPFEKKRMPAWYIYGVIPWIGVVSILTLSPYIFSGLNVNAMQHGAPKAIVEHGAVFFIVTVFTLIIASFFFLIRRILKVNKGERQPYILILVGAVITFALLFTFNLILPTIFENIRFIPLGALTILPFSGFTAYAIYKHKTFKVANLGSSLMAFFLCVATFIEVIFAENSGQLILRLGIFLFVLLISIQFVKNIFALEHLTKSLEDANEQLKSLDKLKSEFISLASHQLRSPLTVIKGYASTLTDGMVGKLTLKQKGIAQHIYTSAQGLASVVEDFLNVSKIEQGGLKYEFAPTNMKSLVEDLAHDMRIIAETKHLAFTVSMHAKDIHLVMADGIKLRQVFLNLIDNSIKYTKEGFVHVALTYDAYDKKVIFSVADSGIGISKETKAKLFTKFGRGEGAMINGGGSGLGLYLAEEIVKAHKGKITATSEGVNKGSTFSVILPCA